MAKHERAISELEKLKYSDWKKYWYDLYSFVEYLEKEVGMLELPCKIGETIYMVMSVDFVNYTVEKAVADKRSVPFVCSEWNNLIFAKEKDAIKRANELQKLKTNCTESFDTKQNENFGEELERAKKECETK